MNIQEIKEALFPFRDYANGERLFEGMNAADLADFLDSLNEAIDGTIHRLEVVLDERGEHTTPVFVEPGVTVTEVGLGESVRQEGEDPGSERCFDCAKWSWAGCLIRKTDPHVDGCDEFEPKGDQGPKDYRKMLEEVGGWDNELASVPSGGVREVIEEVEALRTRVTDLVGQVDIAREILRPIRERVGAEEGEHVLTAFERKFAELEEASGATKPCPHCVGSGKEVLIDSGFDGPLSNRSRTALCSRCGGSGAVSKRDKRCPSCGGTGRKNGASFPDPCPSCNGTGLITNEES